MSGPHQPEPSPLRGDIEGLRAVAVIMVLLYHARIPGISGGFAGVDVFFVISGFLITSLLVREVQRSGRISITKFYARRARRLLPAATLVLIVTAVVGSVVLPADVRAQLGREIIAATFYVVNWELAAQSVNYLAEDSEPSAVQHYWSLSVEEQFYVVWPLIMIAAVSVAAAVKGRAFRYMAVALTLVTVASLAWSITSTMSNPGTAYFATTTRVWELGFGALLAFAVGRLNHLPRAMAEAMSLGGLVLIAVAALFVTSATPWPGSAALLPVAGTTAIIAAGCAKDVTVVGRLLGIAPLRFIGGISYSLYLWHWPLLVLMDEVRPGTGLRGRIAVMFLGVALAYASKRFVEDPVRFRRSLAVSPARALAWGGVAMAASTSVAAAVIVTTPRLERDLPSWAQGARALMVDPSAPEPQQRPDVASALSVNGEVYPSPGLATEDVPLLYEDGCQVNVDDVEPLSCDYGDTDSDTVIAVVGDSKVGQWMPALDQVGQERGWLVRTYTKSACAFTDAVTAVNEEDYTSCREWGQNVLNELTQEDRPDVVVTSSGRKDASREGTDPGPESLAAGYVSYWGQLEESGIEVVVLADNSHNGTEIYTCVADNPQDFTACDFADGEGSGTEALRTAADELSEVEFVDLASWICPEDTCSAVIGRVLVYRQGTHITATYAETLAPVMGEMLAPTLKSASQSAP
ncbi:MAG: acyltransferase family protein [Ornithinimicrobium sp.]